jgi:hypothetical protein
MSGRPPSPSNNATRNNSIYYSEDDTPSTMYPQYQSGQSSYRRSESSLMNALQGGGPPQRSTFSPMPPMPNVSFVSRFSNTPSFRRNPPRSTAPPPGSLNESYVSLIRTPGRDFDLQAFHDYRNGIVRENDLISNPRFYKERVERLLQAGKETDAACALLDLANRQQQP